MATPRSRSGRRLNAMLNVRLTVAQLGDLEDAAEHLGVELAYVVRSALHHGLEAAVRSIDAEIETARHGAPES